MFILIRTQKNIWNINLKKMRTNLVFGGEFLIPVIQPTTIICIKACEKFQFIQ